MITASQRLGVHRFRHENAEEVLRDPYPLIDKDLTAEAERARRALVHSLIEPVGRRACAAFLETDDYAKVAETVGAVMGCLLLECLPRLVRELGGQIAFAGIFSDRSDAFLNPIQHTVQVAGETRPIVDVGYLFVHLPDEKVVVSSRCEDTNAGLVYQLAVRSSRDSAAFFRRWRKFARENNYLRGQAFFADGEILQRRRAYSWDDIMLPPGVRRAIETHVEGFLRNRARLRALGVKPRRGLILEGPPGTGKTLLGKVLADTLEASFLWVSPRHVDHSPPAFAHILEVARFVAPTVLFLEDLDLFAEDRDVRSTMALGELMNQLDGAVDNEDVITIATTNRLEVVEKALRNRPGRFDRVLRLDALDEACRWRLLERLLSRAVISKDNLEHLVSATKDYTGAQLEELTNTLYILAVERYVDGLRSGDGNGDGPAAEAGARIAAEEAADAVAPMPIGRSLIAAALDEFRVELKARVGFSA